MSTILILSLPRDSSSDRRRSEEVNALPPFRKQFENINRIQNRILELNELGILGVDLYIRMKMKRWINRAISTGGRIPLEGKQAADIAPRWRIKGRSKLPRRKWSGPEISIFERHVYELSREFYLSETFIIPLAKNFRGSFFLFFSHRIVKSSDYFNPINPWNYSSLLLFSKFSKRAIPGLVYANKNCEEITRRQPVTIPLDR